MLALQIAQNSELLCRGEAVRPGLRRVTRFVSHCRGAGPDESLRVRTTSIRHRNIEFDGQSVWLGPKTNWILAAPWSKLGDMEGDAIRGARRARGWTQPRLLQAMQQQAQLENVRLMSPGSLRVALSRWENGHHEPDELHCRLLRSVLSLPLTSELDAAMHQGRDYPNSLDSAVSFIDTIASFDLNDDGSLIAASWADSHASQVVTGYIFAKSPSIEVADFQQVRGVAAAERIRATTATLMTMDFQWGGGYVRKMLLQFFRQHVVPELRRRHPDPARREIFSAAAEVAQLLGWSAYDAGRHGAAARYFVQGLKLAEEADDHLMGARLLANLSHQANFLEQFDDAVTYARAAQSALRGHSTQTVESMCIMMEARGLASLSDRLGASKAIHRAERLFEQRNAGCEPLWIAYYDPAELAGDASHCFRDLGLASQTRRFVSDALAPRMPSRTRAFISMVSASAALASGDLEEAASLATAAVREGDGLQSARYVRYLADFHGSVAANHAGDSLLGEFVSLLREHYPQLLVS